MKTKIKPQNRRVGTLCPPSIELPRGHKIVPTLPGLEFHRSLSYFFNSPAVSAFAIK